MRLSRPKMANRAVSAPVTPASQRPKGEQTLKTLRMLQGMGYKDVWCQASDIDEAVLTQAAQDGWRVAAISDNRVKMILGHLPPSPLTPIAPPPPDSAATTPGRGSRPAAPRRPSEQDLPTRAATPPFREPPPSPTARLPKGALSPQAAALVADTEAAAESGDVLPPLSPGEVLSPSLRRMYLHSQAHSRRPSNVSGRSQGSSVPSVVVSPPIEPQSPGPDYFSYQPRAPFNFRQALNGPPAMPPPPLPPQQQRDSADSSYTVDRIADALYDSEYAKAADSADDRPESPWSDSAPSEGIRFEVEEHQPLEQQLRRTVGQRDDYSYIFLPVSPQADAHGARRPSAPQVGRVATAAGQPYSSSDPGHDRPSQVATPAAVPPRWNGLNRKQTPHRRG